MKFLNTTKIRTKGYQVPDGAVTSGFVVSAKPGFSIKGRHKFNLRRKGDRLYAEYCKTCSAARRIIRVGGENVDYVAEALSAQTGWPVEGFDRNAARREFEDLLISMYRKQSR